MQARLKVLHDKANVKQVKLLPVTLIGRSTECNLKIASSQVSRNHCRITLGEDTVYVEDLGSANGTLVDGQRLPANQPTAVAPGAALVVGPAEFVIDYVAPTSATMVLSRPSMPRGPDLPSTELLTPGPDTTMQPGAPGSSSFIPAAIELPIAAPVVPVAKPVVPIAQPVAAVPVAAPVVVPPVNAVVAPVATPTVAAMVPALPVMGETSPIEAPMSQMPEFAPAEGGFAGFGHFSEVSPHEESSAFTFGESSEDVSSTAVESKAGNGTTGKKGGLKSLFSLFGRKGKASPPAGVLPSAAAAAPGVFLPAMEQHSAGADESIAEVSPISFGSEEPASVDASSEQTVTFEQHDTAADTSGGEDDDFTQFLKQL